MSTRYDKSKTLVIIFKHSDCVSSRLMTAITSSLCRKKPLISIFTTMDPQKKNSSASTTSLVSSQQLHAKLMAQEDAAAATLLG